MRYRELSDSVKLPTTVGAPTNVSYACVTSAAEVKRLMQPGLRLRDSTTAAVTKWDGSAASNDWDSYTGNNKSPWMKLPRAASSAVLQLRVLQWLPSAAGPMLRTGTLTFVEYGAMRGSIRGLEFALWPRSRAEVVWTGVRTGDRDLLARTVHADALALIHNYRGRERAAAGASAPNEWTSVFPRKVAITRGPYVADDDVPLSRFGPGHSRIANDDTLVGLFRHVSRVWLSDEKRPVTAAAAKPAGKQAARGAAKPAQPKKR